MTDDSSATATEDGWDRESVEIHAPARAESIDGDENRMLGRPSPLRRGGSGLVSRDYAPRTGGPELVCSWPLGPAPAQTEPGDVDWEITPGERVTLQKNTLQQPYVGAIDHVPLYLNVVGHGQVSTADAALRITLEHAVLSGKPFEVTFALENAERAPFASPMIEAVSESAAAREGYDHLTKVFSGYELSAVAESGTGYLDQGTCVQLWSE